MSNLAEALACRVTEGNARIAMTDSQQSLTRPELAEWVAAAASELGSNPETIGIFGGNTIEWTVAFLAASIAGKTIVPIPLFFSNEQRAHLIRDADIERIIVTEKDDAGRLDLPAPSVVLQNRRNGGHPEHVRDGGLIIYTSGSTGTPKGVRLFSGQALWSAETLARTIAATSEDKYLSLLPFPMLLELICGILIPVLVGGTVHYDTAVAASVGAGAISDIAKVFDRERPTTSVLVPQLLALYAAQLAQTNQLAPPELRFVAVGGAAVPAPLSRTARLLGIPAYEGYGLSECASVVAVNSPDASREGTAGKPLPGLQVTIEDGEIVVQGPSVMDGYLRGNGAPRRWRTGDAGSLDTDGFLSVYGRKDNLIVTPYGRNLSPEWIETMILGDPRAGSCVVCQAGEPACLTALIIPSRLGEGWFKSSHEDDLGGLVRKACEAAPDYARPKRTSVISGDEALARGLFTANGRPRRGEVKKYLDLKGTIPEVQG